MRILAIADEESKFLWDHYKPGCLDDIDLILSAGDLNPEYLEFLVTLSNKPLVYVHGNHDSKYASSEPGGCICADDDLIVCEGIRILGLGGCMKYNNSQYQYTDEQMYMRVLKLLPKICKYKGFDILLTHAPAYELHDDKDLPHRGFKIFRWLLSKFRPRFFVYGHVHKCYGGGFTRYDYLEPTHLINAFERVTFDYEDEQIAEHIR